MKRIIALGLVLLMAFGLFACSAAPVSDAPSAEAPAITEAPAPKVTAEPESADETARLLSFDSYEWTPSEDGSFRSLLHVVYCTNVLCEEYQFMNIYAPAAYFDSGSVGGYTAETAPIVLQNNCGGWMSSKPGEPEPGYLEAGFVYVSCGARSRGAGEEGKYGKSPSAVVDLKAAVRMLRLNAADMPGDEERIISVGTSGGGQMSSILGASGNMDEYYPYLFEIGAAGIQCDEAIGAYSSTIDDDIYGAMCYCPITDLDNADMAYAWMRYDCGETEVPRRRMTFSPFQLTLQNDLAAAYCEYVNGLALKDENGTGKASDRAIMQ